MARESNFWINAQNICRAGVQLPPKITKTFILKESIKYMKNKIILVGGYCASGKTTFAHKLSRELNIPCFNKDAIDEMICDGFGRESDVSEKGSDEVAFYLMLHIAEQLLKAEKICILENVFVLEEIEKIKILLEKYNCECLLFVLKGDIDVMFDRYIERDKAGKRHWIHQPAHKNWFKKSMPATLGLEEVKIGQKIIIDTTSFEKVNYDDLFAAARKFIGDN